MKVRLIADSCVGSDSFELAFEEELPAPLEEALTRGFQHVGFTIKKRRPDGQTIIWECVLPIGHTVDSEMIAKTKLALQVADIQS